MIDRLCLYGSAPARVRRRRGGARQLHPGGRERCRCRNRRSRRRSGPSRPSWVSSCSTARPGRSRVTAAGDALARPGPPSVTRRGDGPRRGGRCRRARGGPTRPGLPADARGASHGRADRALPPRASCGRGPCGRARGRRSGRRTRPPRGERDRPDRTAAPRLGAVHARARAAGVRGADPCRERGRSPGSPTDGRVARTTTARHHTARHVHPSPGRGGVRDAPDSLPTWPSRPTIASPSPRSSGPAPAWRCSRVAWPKTRRATTSWSATSPLGFIVTSASCIGPPRSHRPPPPSSPSHSTRRGPLGRGRVDADSGADTDRGDRSMTARPGSDRAAAV